MTVTIVMMIPVDDNDDFGDNDDDGEYNNGNTRRCFWNV